MSLSSACPSTTKHTIFTRGVQHVAVAIATSATEAGTRWRRPRRHHCRPRNVLVVWNIGLLPRKRRGLPLQSQSGHRPHRRGGFSPPHTPIHRILPFRETIAPWAVPPKNVQDGLDACRRSAHDQIVADTIHVMSIMLTFEHRTAQHGCLPVSNRRPAIHKRSCATTPFEPFRPNRACSGVEVVTHTVGVPSHATGARSRTSHRAVDVHVCKGAEPIVSPGR